MSSTPQKLAAIRDFTEAGFRLIPLNGKIPVYGDWQNTFPGKYVLKDLAEINYGVLLGERDLVIDVDPRNYKLNDDPLQRLTNDIGGSLSGTLIVQTGGGGLHIYLTIPDNGLTLAELIKEYQGLEFKKKGRQLVGPGSTHPDTLKPYSIASGSVAEIKPAPQKLIDIIKRQPLSLNGKSDVNYVEDAPTQNRFIEYLKNVAKPSIEGENGDANALRVALQGRDYALPPHLTLELMMEMWNPRCIPVWTEDELKIKVNNAYKYATKTVGNAHPSADFHPLTGQPAKERVKLNWDTDKHNNLLKTFNNMLTLLRVEGTKLKDLFGYNDFTGRPEFRKEPPWPRLSVNMAVNDSDLKLLKGHLTIEHRYEVSVQTIEEAVVNVAADFRYHPIRDYLNALIWDEKPRLDTWLHDYMGVEFSEYTAACARKTLCAAVMRIFFPGCKMDYVLVLEGDQGIGKSGVIKILGGKWASDAPIDPHSPDTIQLMQGKWILEVAEMEYSNKAETQAIRAFLTRGTDQARFAYGRLPGEFPRQSIFIASMNPGADGTYLKDETGNRRYWPVYCDPPDGRVDFAGLSKVRNQLFAEAVVVLKRGEKLFMDTDHLETEALIQVASRHAEHHWTEVITKWLAMQPNIEFVTSRQVYLGAIGGTDRVMNRQTTTGIATVMKSVGWQVHSVRQGVHIIRGYATGSILSKKRGRKKHRDHVKGVHTEEEISLLGALI